MWPYNNYCTICTEVRAVNKRQLNIANLTKNVDKKKIKLNLVEQVGNWTIPYSSINNCPKKWLNKLLIEQNIIEQKNWTNIVQLTTQWQAYQVLKSVLKCVKIKYFLGWTIVQLTICLTNFGEFYHCSSGICSQDMLPKIDLISKKSHISENFY